MNTAEKLRQLRGNASQKEAAEAIGITTSALSMYENGCRTPRDHIKIKIAKYYGVSVEELFFS